MKADAAWRPAFAGRGPDRDLRSWLTEPGSLTARCQRLSSDFRVRLLDQGRALPLAGEGQRNRICRVREVLLVCDGVPVIFAHSVLSTASGGRLGRWLAGLGSRSLGSLLFSFPGFRRGRLEYLQLDARHPLFRRAAPWIGDTRRLWARRSVHHLDGQALWVTEVFLPGVTELAGSGRR